MEYVIGIDGGGTNTFGLLSDLEGNIYAQSRNGPSNFQVVGINKAISVIQDITEHLRASLPSLSQPIKAIGLGLAGVDIEQDADLIKKHVEGLNIAQHVYVVNDTEIALIGGVGGDRGVAVVAGTGSAAFGCDGKGNKAHVGGWGWILGDEGSAFDIGQQGLRAVIRALEERGEFTSLVCSLIQRWQLCNSDELISALRSKTWSRNDVANMAEWVAITANNGDGVAQQIIRQAGEELGLLATCVIRKLQFNDEFRIVLTGGVFQAGDIIIEPLKQKVHAVAPHAILAPPLYPPVLGAIFMAWRKLGVPLDPDRMANAMSQLSSLD